MMIKRNIDQKLNCLCRCVFYSEQKNNDSSNSDDVTLTHDPVEYKGIYSESNRTPLMIPIFVCLFTC